MSPSIKQQSPCNATTDARRTETAVGPLRKRNDSHRTSCFTVGFVVYPLGYVTHTWTGSTPYVSKQCFFSAAAKYTNTKARKLRIKDEIKFLYISSFRGWMTAFNYLKQLLSAFSLVISFICWLFPCLYFYIWSSTGNRLIWKSTDSFFRYNPRRVVNLLKDFTSVWSLIYIRRGTLFRGKFNTNIYVSLFDILFSYDYAFVSVHVTLQVRVRETPKMLLTKPHYPNSGFWNVHCLSTFDTDIAYCWSLEVILLINPYPTAFPYGNGMVLHFYQQQESSTTKTVHKVINKGLKTYV